MRARVRLAFALIAPLLFVASCSKPPEPDPLQLDGSRLTVNNRTKDDWNDVQVVINRQYRIATPSVVKGQRLDVTLDAFLDVYGNHFYYQRHPIKDVHLTAKTPGGTPVDMHMDFHRSGLDGLADALKKKEKQ